VAVSLTPGNRLHPRVPPLFSGTPNATSRAGTRRNWVAARGYGWARCNLARSPPEEHEFLAFTRQCRSVKPSPSRSHAALSPNALAIPERLARWNRAREIEKWNETLGHLPINCPPGHHRPQRYGFRLVTLEENEPRSVAAPGPRSLLRLIKPPSFSDSRGMPGPAPVHTEAALLWHWSPGFITDRHALRYQDPDAPAPWAGLARASARAVS